MIEHGVIAVGRYVGLKSTVLIVTIFLSSHVFCPAGLAALKGGCAKVNITPPVGIPLIGSYGKPSESVLDELHAKALVLNDGLTTIAIVSADLLYTPLEEIAEPARRIIEEKTGIPQQNILICATHTHSGPEVFTRSKLRPDQEIPASEIDQAYLQTLVRKLADTVFIASRNMRDVKIGAAKGCIPEIVFNRRTQKPDGSVVNTFSINADVASTRKIQTSSDGSTIISFTFDPNKPPLTFGPVDPALCVLRVEDANDNIVGSVINFACHPVCVYPYQATAISADFPADATALVERAEGGICLFTLGTAGDIVPYQRGVKAHQQIGKALGAEALRRLQFVSTSDEVTLDAIKKDIKFPVKKPASADEEKKPDKSDEYITTEMQILRLGDIYILGLPGEVLVEMGLEIKKRAGIDKLFIFSLSNDAIGYVCHSQAYEEGGYESGPATHLAKGAGEIMIEEALDLISRIRQD